MGTKQLREMLSGIVDTDGLKDDETLFSVGINSMEISRLLSRLREECQIEVSFSDFYANSSIAELCSCINAK